MKREIQNKHHEKKSFKKEIRQKCILLKNTLEIIVFNALLHHLNNVVKRKQTAILLRHHKKLEKFRIRQNKHTSVKQNFQSCIAHNFSSYSLSQAEINALSLDYTKTYQRTSTEILFKQNLCHFTKNWLTVCQTFQK